MMIIYKFRACRSQRDSRDFYNYDEENYSFLVGKIRVMMMIHDDDDDVKEGGGGSREE